ncbi:MAG TPA: MG2 domain-containing protein [Bryobacteraceae bacterium]
MRHFAACTLVVCAAAHAQIAVEERATRARLADNSTTISLAIQSPFAKPADVRIALEWLDPKDAVRTRAESVWTAPQGLSCVEIPLAIHDGDDPLLYRLRYSIKPNAANLTAFEPHQGILSFPHIAEHAFRLTAFGMGTPRLGSPYEFRVFAAHPVTGLPVANVEITAEDETPVRTDASGMAIVRLTPDAEDWEEPDEITITGRLGDVVQTVEAKHPGLPPTQVRIYSDKPLYQPGQTLHVRTLALGADGKARAGAAFAIRIRNDRGDVMHATDAAASRFGIAHTDWEIPSNAAAGKYTIEVDDGDSERKPERTVEIRRYELPSFRVAVAPDLPFYLPGQNALVDVRADYLFGKPVAAGKVRISEGEGDDALREGALDASGHFHATVDLSDAHENLRDARFADHHYTAYVTDAGTNRTEQRKFDLRVSRDPLHIYVVSENETTLGRRLYIAAYTPDGKPAQCDLEALTAGRKIGGGRTNRLGLARLDLPSVEDDVVISASGTAGKAVEELSGASRPIPSVRLETDRSLYRAGEPIRCHVLCDRKDFHATLVAWRDGGPVLFSHALALKDGSAEVTIPYDTRFGPEVSIAVLSGLGAEFQASRTVVYPGAGELHITAKAARATYRPGESATVAFQASTGSGAPVEAALGIAVVDQSVFERAATDQAPNRRRWFDYDDARDTRIGGMTRADLLSLDPRQIDADLQLAAEALLQDVQMTSEIADFADDQREAYANAARSSLTGLRTTLDIQYQESFEYPMDEESLRVRGGYYLSTAKDPWMQPYRAEFSREGRYDVLRFVSAGPDKTFGTDDDIDALRIPREWFFPLKVMIANALRPLTDYPANTDEFARTLGDAGLRFDKLKDPWGSSLRAEIRYAGDQRVFCIKSAGPDRKPGTNDDFEVTSFSGTYFRAVRERIEDALSAKPLPGDDAQFRASLASAGIHFDDLRDPWGRPYYIQVNQDAQFTDRVRIYTYVEYQGIPEERRQIDPVKRRLLVIEIRSRGEDGVPGSYDDFAVAAFSKVVMEDEAPLKPAPPAPPPSVTFGGRGTITGIVTDRTGAVIPYRAEVTLGDDHRTRTDERGVYVFRGVPLGIYTVKIQAPGFRISVIDHVPVRAARVTRVDAVLDVGAVSETVEVAAAPVALMTTESAEVAAAQAAATYTPRVRDYFPETLLWNPELVTDRAGRASLGFKLADSITEWNVAVIGSTEDGRIAEASTAIRAFQPFFVDLDPPRVLTVGDEISLPVPVRNYLTADQSVSLDVTAPSALAVTGAPNGARKVAASSTESAVAGLRAVSTAEAASLRITARGKDSADAVEKPVAIHPDGEPAGRSVSDILVDGRVLRIETPANAIPGSLRGEVKLYPTLLAHVMESIEGLVRKPTGCAEQTISSSYPNLLVLRALERAGMAGDSLGGRARRNLRSGYQRLVGYRKEDGSFGYWVHSESNAAVTAYAIQFLEDAKGLIDINDSFTDDAREWLSNQPLSDRAVLGLSMRALARAGREYEGKVLDRLGELARNAAPDDDPYAIATFALAAMDASHPELAQSSIDRLRSLARTEEGAIFWHLRRNTPFYGWGRAGVLETTALAVTALSRWNRHTGGADAALRDLIDRGVLFLIRGKDRQGVWLTTQATVRTLEALLDVLASGDSQPFTAEVLVNGERVGRVTVPGSRKIQGPVTLDVSRWMRPGIANELALSVPAGAAATHVQFTAAWYEPWKAPPNSSDLKLDVVYSKTEAAVNELIACDVTVSRAAFRGFGMTIAEIGLPPGAEVDRGSLQELVESGKYGVDSFEVAPDHVTFYVWPHAADSTLRFIFRPRYAMRAQTAGSRIYDYYNPDAGMSLRPVRMTVR